LKNVTLKDGGIIFTRIMMRVDIVLNKLKMGR
jgi:hypothetical protein